MKKINSLEDVNKILNNGDKKADVQEKNNLVEDCEINANCLKNNELKSGIVKNDNLNCRELEDNDEKNDEIRSSKVLKGCKAGFKITEEIENLDKLKSKVLKYVTYKKRTINEVKQKFSNENQDLLEEVIEYFISQNYINEEEYIEKSIKEFLALKSLSIKEINFKLSQKGVDKKLLDNYICNNKEKLLEFEINSAKKLILKQQGKKEMEDIKRYLFQKGYMQESISIALDELDF